MRYLGAHMSTSGGLHTSVERIARVNGTALQLFSRNQRQWKAKPVTVEEAVQFRNACDEWGNYPVAVHGSYLMNFASTKQDAVDKTVGAFAAELVRTMMLGIPYVVVHPGAHLNVRVDEAPQRVAAVLDAAIAEAEAILSGSCEEFSGLDITPPKVLLENTAGQGSAMGADFADIARIFEASDNTGMMGMCLDTAHAFAAGYDFRTAEIYAETMAELDTAVGLNRLYFIHCNDSKTPLGSRVDRHAHIGEGELGIEAFRLLLNDSRLAEVPMVLETPKDETLEDDVRNLETLRSLVAE